MNTPFFEVHDLSFSYEGNRKVLNGLSFSAQKGEVVSLLGKNGAGKSTLFQCILGIHRTYGGTITADGRNMKELSARELARIAAYIPQSHYSAFNYSAVDMVLMGAANQLGSIGSPGKKEKAEALELMEKLGILSLSERGFSRLSGGEQQMVLIARAMMQKAGLWILDEPLASLDYGNRIRTLKKLKELSGEGYLILQSIHEPDWAYQYSDRIVALKDGAVLREGSPAGVMDEELIRELYGRDISWKKPDPA